MSTNTVKNDIVRRLDQLSPEALHDVLDYLKTLEQGQEPSSESSTLLDAAGTLSGEPLTAEQIERTLYGEFDE